MNKLTFLFDGKCPLCIRETKFLKSKDKLRLIDFIDISNNYLPQNFQNISYVDAMLNLHGILEDGEVIKGLDVLINAYDLVGLGWIYAPLKFTYIYPIAQNIYKLWARNRLRITGRGNKVQLCFSENNQGK